MEDSKRRAKQDIHVLVAEDEASNYLLLKTILQKHCTLSHAKTGVEALSIYNEHPEDYFDIILMDIKMPEMGGIEAVCEIRKANKVIPIIMQSAYVFDSDVEAAEKAGATDFITKPINLKVLKQTISKYIEEIIW